MTFSDFLSKLRKSKVSPEGETTGDDKNDSNESDDPTSIDEVLTKNGLSSTLKEALQEDGITRIEDFGLSKFSASAIFYPKTVELLGEEKKLVRQKAEMIFDDLYFAHKASYTKNTPDEKTDQSKMSGDQSAELLEKANKISEIKAALKPFEDEAVNNARAEGEAANTARDNAKSLVNKELHSLNITLPENKVTVKEIGDFLDDCSSKYLNTYVAETKPDLTTDKLFSQLGLLQGLYFTARGVTLQTGRMIDIQPNAPLLRFPKYTYDFRTLEVTETIRSSDVSKMESEIGLSWGVAASTKGAASMGGGIGAWSASTRLAGAHDEKHCTDTSTSSQSITSMKKVVAVRCVNDYCIGAGDYRLSGSLCRYLNELLQIVFKESEAAGAAGDEGSHSTLIAGIMTEREWRATKEKCLDIFNIFGTHISMCGTLGGAHTTTATITASAQEYEDVGRNVVADSLTFALEGSVAAAFPVGAGSVSAGINTESSNSNKESAGGKGESISKRVSLNMYTVGGQVGPVQDWLKSLEGSGSNTRLALLDRDPNHVWPLWHLISRSDQFEDINVSSYNLNASFICNVLELVWCRTVAAELNLPESNYITSSVDLESVVMKHLKKLTSRSVSSDNEPAIHPLANIPFNIQHSKHVATDSILLMNNNSEFKTEFWNESSDTRFILRQDVLGKGILTGNTFYIELEKHPKHFLTCANDVISMEEGGSEENQKFEVIEKGDKYELKCLKNNMYWNMANNTLVVSSSHALWALLDLSIPGSRQFIVNYRKSREKVEEDRKRLKEEEELRKKNMQEEEERRKASEMKKQGETITSIATKAAISVACPPAAPVVALGSLIGIW